METLALGKDVIPKFIEKIGGSKSGPAPKILVVEDSRSTRKLMRSVLEFEGFEVLEAESGVEALAFAQWNSNIMVVLLDLNLHEGDGHHVLQELEKLQNTRDIKSCVISATGDDATVDLCINEGADDFVAQGINYEILVHKLKTLLHADFDDSSFKTMLANLKGKLFSDNINVEVKIRGISQVEIRVQTTEPLDEGIHLKLECPFLGELLEEPGYQIRVRSVETRKFHGQYVTDCEIIGLSLAKTAILKSFTDKSGMM